MRLPLRLCHGVFPYQANKSDGYGGPSPPERMARHRSPIKKIEGRPPVLPAFPLAHRRRAGSNLTDPTIMKNLARIFLLFLPGVLAALPAPASPAMTSAEIPVPLRPWETWATWDVKDMGCPTPYMDARKPLSFWPSRVAFQVDKTSGRFDLGVTVFGEAWIPLPGGREVWPVGVKVNGTPVPVLDRKGRPSVRLQPGTFRIEGGYRWNEIPQRIPLPREIGILTLALEGRAVESPVWDAQGFLWLKRDASTEETDKDFLAVKAYALVEDGIPLWLRTEVELIVSGKSREEEIGGILPEGWKLSSVECPIPVAVDDAGRMKAQVRAGKWTVNVSAFRIDNPKEFRWAAGSKPAVPEELVAFRSKPDFRMVDIVGAPATDVSQTTFPAKWREFPVYLWDTAKPFQIEERMRGMGLQKPAGLNIQRELWLDESGGGLTFRDRITGKMQEIWRLDAAEGQDLGSVRSGGEGRLITRNPRNGAPGVEIRARDITLEAAGRMGRQKEISATGWRSDADKLDVTLNLPPGWRLYALFGADWVRGDWLTAWTLLDLFLLLIFSLAVSKLWGPGAAALAFLAFGLSYHEPGAPRYVWLVLLMPVALLRVVPPGWGHRLLAVWKWLTAAALVLILVPFLAQQVQQTLYPQLENVGGRAPAAPAAFGMADDGSAGDRESLNVPAAAPLPEMAAPPAPQEKEAKAKTDSYASGGLLSSARGAGQQAKSSNLSYDNTARIQTGPGVPDWTWRTVRFGWNGPVQAGQQVRPILISLQLERAVAILRIALLLALAGILLNARTLAAPLFRSRGNAALAILLAAWSMASANAQMPDQQMLDTLKNRLMETSDAYPNAADIPHVSLVLDGRKLAMDLEIHAAIRTAVPLPGRLPAWSPATVTVDGRPEAALRRDDGYIWLVLPEGVHRVRVEGLIADVTEWEWTFQLKPHRVAIEAPGWTFSGVRPDGLPEQQVFFALKQKAAAGEASYDRQDFQSVASVDRHLELGLVWQARTTVTRLSGAGKALSLRVPLLPGENVISSNAIVKDGFIEVRLGSQDPSFAWESELPVKPAIALSTKASDAWVETWHLVASPVWNVAFHGLAPVFEPANTDLVPVWHPWPGEGVELAVSRPEALAGATVTVRKGTHSVALGKRQRTSTLDLSLRCSLGEDFLIGLPQDAEITSLKHAGKAIPVRKDGNRLIVPLRPGEQPVLVAWKSNIPLGFRADAGEVRLPVGSANIDTVISVPDDRWVLWAGGPLRGPAVRFWGILVCSLLAAGILGRAKSSPLRAAEWMLLAIGLTQVPLPAALAVIGWLFLLSWRGRGSFLSLPAWCHNLLQVAIVILTAAALGIFVAIVAEGLLGNPEMFIAGNGSTRTALRWYQARCEPLLPNPGCLSISIWWYRLLMLAWALWLAASLIRWLRWAWEQFCAGGCVRRGKKKPAVPPPITG